MLTKNMFKDLAYSLLYGTRKPQGLSSGSCPWTAAHGIEPLVTMEAAWDLREGSPEKWHVES